MAPNLVKASMQNHDLASKKRWGFPGPYSHRTTNEKIEASTLNGRVCIFFDHRCSATCEDVEFGANFF